MQAQAVKRNQKISKKQALVMKHMADPTSLEVILDGSRNSGKSHIAIDGLLERAIEFPKTRHMTIRYRRTDCKMKLWKQSLVPQLKMAIPNGDYDINWSDLLITLFNGSEIYGAGLDDKDRAESALGGSYQTMLFEELAQISYDSYDTARGSCRKPVKGLPLKVVGTLNPKNKKVWQYKRFILGQDPDGKPLNRKEVVRIGPWLPKDNPTITKQEIKVLDSLTGVNLQRYRHGLWVDVSGLVYPNFEDAIAVMSDGSDMELDDIKEEWIKAGFSGIDWGYTNPFCQLWCAYDKSNETVYIYDERYEAEKDAEIHAREIEPTWKERKPKWVTADHDSGDRATFKRHGLPTIAAIKKDKAHSRDVFRTLMGAKTGLKIRFLRRCVNLIEEGLGYSFPDRRLSKNESEEPIEKDNHAMDVCCYISREIEHRMMNKKSMVYGSPGSITRSAIWN